MDDNSKYHVLGFLRKQLGLSVRKLIVTLKYKSMITFLGILALFFVTSCTNDSDKINIAYSYFRAGMFDAVLKGEVGDQYKGLIYEFGLGVDKDVLKARGIYSRLNDKNLSSKRLFMLCFVYCVGKMDRYYHSSKREYNIVIAIYAIDKSINGEDCNVYADYRVCKVVNSYDRDSMDVDLYYEIGREIYEIAMEAKMNIKSFELPYYLLTKSAINGNQSARKYLESIPYKYSWIPNVQN